MAMVTLAGAFAHLCVLGVLCGKELLYISKVKHVR